MNPSLGVSLELLALALSLALVIFVPAGPIFGLYVLGVQLLSAYLVHCPAHYLAGSLLGIRFRGIRLGRATISDSLPPALRGPARLVPVPYLATNMASIASAPPRRGAAMYASGAAASTASTLIIALAATFAEPLLYAVLAWGVALAYLASDLVLSPKSGDLKKARAALRLLPSS